jgi:hypothetical protein
LGIEQKGYLCLEPLPRDFVRRQVTSLRLYEK